MTLPGNPPATTTPAAFKTWAQNVADTAADHETRVDALEAASGLGVSLGDKVYRYTDAASPLTLVSNVSTLITEALMDTEDGTVSGVTWSNTNDRYDITEDGLFYLGTEIEVDSSAKAAFAGQFWALISCGNTTEGIKGPPIPYGTGIDLVYPLSGVRFIEAGEWVQLWVKSENTGVNMVYGELAIRRLA